MTKEIANLSELEKVLDILQSIRDREVNRRLPPGNYKPNHVEYSSKRNSYNEHNNMNRNYHYKSGEWRCYRCQQENVAFRQQCFKCRLPREVQRRREEMKQDKPQGREAPNTREGVNNNQGPTKGCLLYTSGFHQKCFSQITKCN